MIDGHAHIGFFHKKYPIYIKDLDSMVAVMDKFGIEKSVVSSLKAIQYDFVMGNQEVKEACDRYPDRFIPISVVHPRHREDAKRELLRTVKEWGFRALKLHPVDQCFPADCLSSRRIVQTAVELDIPVFFHCSQDDFANPYRIARVAKEFPEAKIVMCHMGKILFWQDCVELAEEFGNLILDLTDAMFVENLIETSVKYVGAERIIWGTNLPISYPGPNIKRVEIAKISQEDKEKIFSKNIKVLLKLT